MLRVATYARFSSDLQRATSIDDQITTARRYADAQGWTFLDTLIFTDAAVSGASLDRPGIQALMMAAARVPRPFDVLLVDDSSRVSRDLADAVRLLQNLKFAGVRVVYISQNIDSANEQAETLIAVHGVVDSLFLMEMAKKIKRGLAGQIDRGFATGSITYGYRTIPVPDPSGKTDVNGYPVLLGKRVEIDPAQARVVKLIFEWYADGLGALRIVERLHRERHPGPRGRRWQDGAVKRVLQNEKYTGKLIWGKKTFERRPGTRQQVERPVPREHWRVQERPELRIIADDLWERVQARRAVVRTMLPTDRRPGLMRGRHAALHSPHLFSGFMKCGTCGGAVVIVTGGHRSSRYGCLRSGRNGVDACSNRLTVRAKIVDARLLEELKRQLLDPGTVRYVADALAAELNRLIDERPRLDAAARAAREQATQRLRRLVDAIESGVPPATLSAAIVEREAEIAALDVELTSLAQPLRARLAVMPAWVRQQLQDLAGLLSETPQRTKTEFHRLGLAVTMHAVRDEGLRPFYRAVGRASLPCLAGITDVSGSTVDRSGAKVAWARNWWPDSSTS
jgi:site-specific DNA recombinase